MQSASKWLICKVSHLANYVRLIGLRGHKRNIQIAGGVLSRISEIHRSSPKDSAGARVFGYLRKVHPMVFEELILTAIQNGGRFVLRNRRYTGDGGVDGRFYEPGLGWVLVQCKRYKSHISHVDLREFSAVVEGEGCVAGVFVHTGRTGEFSWAAAKQLSNVLVVSGDRLLALILRSRIF